MTIGWSPIDGLLGLTVCFGDGIGAGLSCHLLDFSEFFTIYRGDLKIPKNKSCNLFII